jgi:hypothetical protein
MVLDFQQNLFAWFFERELKVFLKKKVVIQFFTSIFEAMYSLLKVR